MEKRIDAPYKPEKNAENFDKKQTSQDNVFKGDDPIEMREASLKLLRPSV